MGKETREQEGRGRTDRPDGSAGRIGRTDRPNQSDTPTWRKCSQPDTVYQIDDTRQSCQDGRGAARGARLMLATPAPARRAYGPPRRFSPF